jgi:mono/diheme cytochrome c family protein
MLGSIPKKRPQEWLMSFIQDSQEVIVSGDAYANFLFQQYNQQVMPDFGGKLSGDDITDILHYIEEESIHPTEPIEDDADVERNGSTEVLKGKWIFQTQCATCHHVLSESSQAPALGSVSKRRPHAWLVSFIHNSQKVITSGDPYATQLFGAFESRVMVPMEFLSEDEIDAVLAYIGFMASSEHNKAGVNGKAPKLTQPTTPRAHVDANLNPWRGEMKVFFIILTSLAACVHIFLVAKLVRYLQ